MSSKTEFAIHPEDPIWSSQVLQHLLASSDTHDLIVQKTPGAKVSKETLNLMLVKKTDMRKMIDIAAKQEKKSKKGFF